MGRMIPALLAVLITVGIFGCSHPDKKKLRSTAGFVGTSKLLLGPEVLAHCGGYLQVWASSPGYGNSLELFIKVTPPEGQEWKFWNAHVIVEKPSSKNVPARFLDRYEFDTSEEDGNVARFYINLDGSDPSNGLNVAFKPFEGCGHGKTVGVTLKPSELY